MGEVNTTAIIHTSQHAESKAPTKATLKADGKEHTFLAFAETESASQGVNKFLSEINEMPELPETFLEEYTFTVITQETIEVETEIMRLFEELEKPQTPEKQFERPKNGEQSFASGKTAQSQKFEKAKPLPETGKMHTIPSQPTKGEQVVYSSLFSMAYSFNKGLSEARKTTPTEQQQKQPELRKETRSNTPLAFNTPQSFLRDSHFSETRHERDQEKDEEGSGGNQDRQEQQEEQQKRRNVFNLKAGRTVSKTTAVREDSSGSDSSSTSSANHNLGSIENVYIRFMALMARILGQAEAEAHELYLRIKERTDNIDLLTLLLSKLNSEKGAIDWTNNEEMKKLIEKARALGVDIPQGKLKWTEEEKKMFKENIQMRKDSMEKVTQLERTDMQRYLQEASQCHQARSNVLKLLKEVMDTIIHNMRP